MEAFLHYLWASRRWLRLIPTGAWAGQPLEVIDPGRLNYHAGPDFLEARVRIGDLLWCGAVEIHRASAEWYRHGHQDDPAYSSVILHVVECDDRPVSYPSGEGMPTCILLVPEPLRAEERQLVLRSRQLPPAIGELPQEAEDRHAFFTCLYRLRLKAKLSQVDALLSRSGGDWGQTGYALLLRYFGFGLNNDAFTLLAFHLPLHLLQKHRDDIVQLEALLLGTAGLLAQLPAGEEREAREREYTFLSYKYQLKHLPPGACRRARTRPANLPEWRLLQLAQLLHHTPTLTELLTQTLSPSALQHLLAHPVSTPWQGRKGCGEGRLSSSACLMLLINVFTPYQQAYRAYYADGSEAIDPARVLDALPAEDNRITRLFASAGIPAVSALESQAMLEWYERYGR